MKTTARKGQHGRCKALGILRNVLKFDLVRERERVSAGEEAESHCMLRDRRQKRRGNQQRKVWYEKSGDVFFLDFSFIVDCAVSGTVVQHFACDLPRNLEMCFFLPVFCCCFFNLIFVYC